MKRALIALAAMATAALAALTVAAPAGAATNTQVIQYRDLSASAFWHNTRTTPTGTAVTDSSVQVTKSTQGWYQMYADQFISYYGADGTFLGATQAWGWKITGFPVSINPALRSASTSATGLVGDMVTYDANWTEISTDYNYPFGDASATWTGQGQATSSGYRSRYHEPGYNRIETIRGTSRPATATGTVAGVTFSADDLVSGQLSNVKNGSLTVTAGR